MSQGNKQRARQGFLVTLLVLLGLAVFFYFNFKTVVVRGNSMETTYSAGDRVLSSKAYWLIGGIQRKDVVVLKDPMDPNGYIIKRVLGLAGDPIDFENVPRDWRLSKGEYKVPEASIYVVGDNRSVSEDSRVFGPVPLESVLGKVVHVELSNLPMSGFILLFALFAVGLVWFLARMLIAK